MARILLVERDAAEERSWELLDQTYDPDRVASDLDRPPRPRCLSLLSLDEQPRLRLPVVPGLIERGSLTVVGGAPGSSKSWLAMALVSAVASDSEVLGFSMPSGGRAAYCDFEHGPRELTRRFRALGARDAVASGRLWIPTGLPLVSDAAWRDVMQDLAFMKPDLVVIDTLASAAIFDENSPVEVERVLASVHRGVQAWGGSTLVLHHLSKGVASGGRAAHIDRLRGSGHLAGRVDQVLLVADAPGGSRRCTERKHRWRPEIDPIDYELLDERGGVTVRLCAPNHLVQRTGRDESLPDDVRERLAASPATATELATLFDLTRQGAEHRLKRLAARGLVSKSGGQWTLVREQEQAPL